MVSHVKSPFSAVESAFALFSRANFFIPLFLKGALRWSIPMLISIKKSHFFAAMYRCGHK
jgi:hypothetical protein